MISDSSLDESKADDANLEELHHKLAGEIHASVVESRTVLHDPIFLSKKRTEIRAYFGIKAFDPVDVKSVRKKAITVDSVALEYVELPYDEKITVRSLRIVPGGQSKGVVVLLHGWPSDIYSYYRKDGYGLVLANAGWTVYSPFMYHSKDPNLYYEGLKHQHNFVQLSRKAEIIGQDILGIELQKADFLVNSVNYFEKPKTLAVAGVSMGGHYSVILGAINTSIDVTVVSSWFDDYLKKYWLLAIWCG